MDPAAEGAGGEAMTVALPDLIQLFQMVASQGGAGGAPAPAPAEGGAGGAGGAEGGAEPEKKPSAAAGKDAKLDMIMSKLDTLIGALGMAELMAPAEGGAAMPPAETGMPEGENALAPAEGGMAPEAPIPAIDASGAAPPPPTGGMTVAASARPRAEKKAESKTSRAQTLSKICNNLRSGRRR